MKYILVSIVALSLAATSATAQSASAAGQQASASLDVKLPDGVMRADLGKRDLRMIAVQVMLDRSRHSPGVIDGYGGGNTKRAVRAYREANGLPAGTTVDRALLSSLLETQGGDVFRTYAITSDDANYNFVDVPSGFAAQAGLDRLNYETPVEMLAERFHMDEEFLKALNPGKDFSRAGTTINIVSHGDEKLQGQVARIEVRKSDDSVVAFDAAGKVLASYPATIGSSQFPSPSGSMTVNAVAPQANYTFTPEGREWGPDQVVVIAAGPNNPVGGTWIDLSKDGYGIHGSPDPQLIAKTASHGCVRLTNWDADELAAAVSRGVSVEFL